MFRKPDECIPEEPKICKTVKVKVIKEKECIEPLPPDYKEREYFKLGAPDPLDNERAKCLMDCRVKTVLTILRECDKRVTRKLLYTAETCHEETIDLMEALDECVKDKAFKLLQ